MFLFADPPILTEFQTTGEDFGAIFDNLKKSGRIDNYRN